MSREWVGAWEGVLAYRAAITEMPETWVIYKEKRFGPAWRHSQKVNCSVRSHINTLKNMKGKRFIGLMILVAGKFKSMRQHLALHHNMAEISGKKGRSVQNSDLQTTVLLLLYPTLRGTNQ